MIRRLALALVVLALAAPAQAAPTIDAQGAQAFKALLQKTLADYESTMMAGSPLQVVKEGDLVVDVAEGYYAATLPSITLVGPAGSDGQPVARLGIGKIAINAVPGAREGLYTLAVAVPPTMHMTVSQGPNSKPGIVDISVGEQRANIVTWDSALDARWGVPFVGALQVRTDYRDLALRVNPGQVDAFDVDVAALRYTKGYALDAQDRLSGPMGLTLEGIAAQGPEERAGPRVALGSFGVTGKLADIDANGMVAHAKSFMDIQARLNAALAAGQEPSAADGLAMFDAMAGLYTRILSSMEIAYTLKDLSVDWPDPSVPSGAPGRAGVTLAEASVAARSAGFDSDAASVHKAVTYKGLVITPPPVGVGPAIPAEGQMHVALESFPVQMILAKVRGAILAGTQNPNMGPVLMMGLMTQIPTDLAQSGATLSLSDTGVSNAIYTLTAQGTGQMAPSSPAQIQGTLRLVFTGLDALLAALQAETQAGGIQAAMASGALVQSLQQAQALGDKAADKDAYTFAFALGPDGQMTLNGKPFPPAPVSLRAPQAPAPGAQVGPVE